MDINAANLDIIFRQAANNFQEALIQSPSLYAKVTTSIPVQTRQITQGWLDRIPQMRKWKGNRVINDAVAHARAVLCEPYEDTVSLSKWDVQDDQLGIFTQTVKMLGQAVMKFPDQLLWNFLQIAGSSAANGYDGVPVYSASHPLLGGVGGGIPLGAPSTQSNLYLSTALTWDNYVTVRQNMMAWKGADGAPLMITPNLLMVPPQLEGKAKQILEADFRPDIQGNSNAPASNTYKGTAQILVNPWLSAWPVNWWLLDTTQVVQAFAYYLLTAAQFTYLTNPNDQNVFMTAEFLYGAELRAAISETVWWLSSAATANGAYIGP